MSETQKQENPHWEMANGGFISQLKITCVTFPYLSVSAESQ